MGTLDYTVYGVTTLVAGIAIVYCWRICRATSEATSQKSRMQQRAAKFRELDRILARRGKRR